LVAPHACGACGAALADDQRYCLACGQRSGTARLPFLDILREGEPPATAAAAPSLAGTGRHTQLPLVVATGVLVMALLVGVLLGHWSGGAESRPAAAAPAQVITVRAPAAAATASRTAPPVLPADAPSKSHHKAAKHAGKPAAAPAPANLKNLKHLSGTAYQKQVDKLGKHIRTGGKPPPKDKKPAAGGGSFQEIG
jgi:hypothetical protein